MFYDTWLRTEDEVNYIKLLSSLINHAEKRSSSHVGKMRNNFCQTFS